MTDYPKSEFPDLRLHNLVLTLLCLRKDHREKSTTLIINIKMTQMLALS